MVDQPAGEENRGEDEQGRVEFSFPLLIFRAKIFTRVYDRLGSLRVLQPAAWAAMVGMPAVAGFGLYFIVFGFVTLLTSPAAREIGRELGPQVYIILPGVNPYVPIFYGWIALIVAIVLHEGAHGVIARSRGFKVKSSGLLFFFIVPVGAFVDVDEDELASAKPKRSIKVFAAGAGANVAAAVACILGVLLITGGLTPVIDGLYVFEVMDGTPAQDAGIMVRDVIVSVDDLPISDFDVFESVLDQKNPGDTIEIKVARGEKWSDQFSTTAILTEDNGSAYLGVSVGELLTEQRLRTYQKLATEMILLHFMPPTLASGLVPFSGALSNFYAHPLGENWHILASFLFWMWFVNINIAIFNSLPIYPLDGGQALKAVLKSLLGHRLEEKTISQIMVAITAVLLSVVALTVVIPFVM
ncbi:MAG: site-2 protease family protein [Candidatus Bathyarchaeota archaeon]|nr:MAG: site-2 protease family protein [Candidatus Bathyarchaeota archaeon]